MSASGSARSEQENVSSSKDSETTAATSADQKANSPYNEADLIIQSTRDLLKKKKEGLRKIEEQSDQNVELTEKENQQMNREISEIILRADGKLRCLFNP